jgi:hypothetical protein
MATFVEACNHFGIDSKGARAKDRLLARLLNDLNLKSRGRPRTWTTAQAVQFTLDRMCAQLWLQHQGKPSRRKDVAKLLRRTFPAKYGKFKISWLVHLLSRMYVDDPERFVEEFDRIMREKFQGGYAGLVSEGTPDATDRRMSATVIEKPATARKGAVNFSVKMIK